MFATVATNHNRAVAITRRFHGRYILIVSAEPIFHQSFTLKRNINSSRPGYCTALLPWWSDTFVILRNQLLCCSTMYIQKSNLLYVYVCACPCTLPSQCPLGRAVKWPNMEGSEESVQRNTTSEFRTTHIHLKKSPTHSCSGFMLGSRFAPRDNRCKQEAVYSPSLVVVFSVRLTVK